MSEYRMFFRRRPKKAYRLPHGQRVYAIGDVHGRLDLLKDLLEKIEEDAIGRPATQISLIFLGDLVDRGPQSAQVVALVKRLCEAGHARLVLGNHEEMFIEAANGEARGARALCSVGGMATILSYGIDEHDATAGSFAELAVLLAERIPRDDVAFLEQRSEDLIEIGDYVFVHAGIRPGVAFEEQSPEDLRWIRGDFLRSERDHGAIVVHGHTIVETAEEKPNRICIDTGAFRSGVLTALALEGEDRWFITAEGAPGVPDGDSDW